MGSNPLGRPGATPRAQERTARIDLSRARDSRLLVLAAGLGCVLLFQALLPLSAKRIDSSDYLGFYEPVARQILDGQGPVLADGRPATRYPPGYPALLAGLFGAAHALGLSDTAVLTALSALAMALASLLLLELAASVWPRRRALLAPLAFTTYPLALWLAKQPNSEVPFLVPLYGSVLLFWSVARGARCLAVRAVGCGAVAGVAMLIRPIALGLGVALAVLALALACASASSRIGTAVLVLAGNFAVVLPWEVWVYRQTGDVILLSTGGVPAMRDGLTFAGQRKGSRRSIAVPPDVAELEADIEGHYQELRSVRDIMILMREEWSRRPVAVSKLLAW
ncbi:MAG: hypothetical protein ACRD1B_07300, partial [Thermoanaerobaculia bacterium]